MTCFEIKVIHVEFVVGLHSFNVFEFILHQSFFALEKLKEKRKKEIN